MKIHEKIDKVEKINQNLKNSKMIKDKKNNEKLNFPRVL
jgi:hypothetical protein